MVPRLLLLLLIPVQSHVLRHMQGAGNRSKRKTNSNVTGSNVTRGQTNRSLTLTSYYDSHTFGRGIWKWNNALVAYQRYFSAYAGTIATLAAGGVQFKIAEIGVQSGGSLDMWKAVLGPSCYAYGLDINPAAQQFADARTTITIGDQGDGNMWANFWTYVTSTVDVLIDDGSHEPHHMSMALHQAFPHLNPSGFVAIEDIHGRHYTQSFFWPAANSIHNWQAQGLVESVSLFPFLLVVKKTWSPFAMPPLPPADVTVNSFPALWAALAPNPGKMIALQNPAWGSFLALPTLYNIFEQFAPLHDYQMSDTPAGCHKTSSPTCTVSITNSNSQAYITAVDIYPTVLYVHVPAVTPVIQAVRKGTFWIPY